jgi:uncharacterized Zn-binding protein involved in type VI secretion
MSKAIRKSDATTGHGLWDSQTILEGSPNVFINGQSAVRVGDRVATHCAPVGETTECHDGTVNQGSPNVFVNGKPKARFGDGVSCGGTLKEGSENVLVN